MTDGVPPLDADRLLALQSLAPERRAPIETLWMLDAVLGGQLAAAGQPMIAQIRLAWWREALDRLDREPPPAEPLLESVAGLLLPAGITGAALARMAEGWEILVAEERLSRNALETFARLRGTTLFRMSSELLGGKRGAGVDAAGAAWSLVDLGRRSRDREERAAAFDLAREEARRAARRWSRRLRPLGMLASVARRDLARGSDRIEAAGVPPRTLRMLWLRLTGL